MTVRGGGQIDGGIDEGLCGVLVECDVGEDVDFGRSSVDLVVLAYDVASEQTRDIWAGAYNANLGGGEGIGFVNMVVEERQFLVVGDCGK